MTVETIAQPEPLLEANGRTVIEPRGPAPDDAGDCQVVAAPNHMLFIGGRYNGIEQWFSIDPGDAFPRVIAALEEGRAIANADRRFDHPPSDRSIIAALRLALYEGYAREDRALEVARAILDHAAPSDNATMAANDAGVSLLIRLLKAGRLQAEVRTS